MKLVRTLLIVALSGGLACGDDDGGTDAGTDTGDTPDVGMDDGGGDTGDTVADLTVLLEAEDTITEGLDAGDCDECITDGWAVSFDKYIIAIGEVDLHLSTDETVTAEDADIFVYDLTQVPAAGDSLWSFTGLQVGTWELNYLQAHGGEGTRHESVSEEDFAAVAEATYAIEGTMTNGSGRTCPPNTDSVPGGAVADGDGCYENTSISFNFIADAETVFGPCEAEDGPPGVAVVEGGSTASLTIHGDHIFFNGFPEGDEGSIARLAQWLADCDLNLDGEVTQAELESIAIDDLAEIDSRFDLGGAPPLADDEPLDDMWAYVRTQLKTQGHFNGEGECPVDGVAHMHE